MSFPTKRQAFFRPANLLATVAIAGGLTIAASAAWQMFAVEDLAATSQQKAAEVEPLVVIKNTDEVGDTLRTGDVFAKLIAPRLGSDYVRQIAQGTSVEKVLNTIGVGHYISTAMPGEVGNFALAAHRAGNGGPFRDIDKFQAGDLVYVETATATYTYRYLQTAVVAPDAINVIAAKPEGLTATTSADKFLTLTTCTPIYVNTDRLIVWFEQIAVAAK